MEPIPKGDPTYPTGDGKPIAETPYHLRVLFDLLGALWDRYEDNPDVYVSGDMLLFYEEGNRRKHVAPDVFVTFGVPKEPPRLNYIVWQEGKAPDVIFEITSKTTRKEDQTKKWTLYRDVLRVSEYFLFDPFEDYLRPPMQGYRLVGDQYVPIEPVEDRLPCESLGLHLERDGKVLQLYDPQAGRCLATPRQRAAQAEAARDQAEAERDQAHAERRQAEIARRQADAARRRAESERQQAEAAREHAENAQQQADAARLQAESENERLHRELAELRRRQGDTP